MLIFMVKKFATIIWFQLTLLDCSILLRVHSEIIFPSIPSDCVVQIITDSENLIQEQISNYLATHTSPVLLTTSNSYLGVEARAKQGGQLAPPCTISLYLFDGSLQIIEILLESRLVNNEGSIWYIFIPKDLSRMFYSWDLDSFIYEVGHPRLAVIIYESGSGTKIEWQINCYLCPDKPPIQEQLGTVPHPEDVAQIFEKLNSQGYGRPILAAGSYPSNTISARRLEIIGKTKWREAQTINVFVGILSSRHNFTFDTPLPRMPRMYMCIACDPPSEPHPIWRPGHVFIIFVNDRTFLYCQKSVALKETGLDFIFKPLESTALILLALSLIMMFFLNFRDPWNQGLGFLWLILSQPIHIRKKASFKTLIGRLSLLALFIQQYYLAFFTLDVVVPFAPIQIETYSDLFGRGFKIIDGGNWNWDKSKYEEGFRKHKLDLSGNSTRYFIQDWKCKEGEEGQDCLASAINFGTHMIQSKYASSHILYLKGIRRRLHCNVVKNTFVREWVTFNLNSHLSGIVADTIRKFLAGGIDQKWEKNYVDGDMRRSGRNKEEEINAMSLSTPILSFFKLWSVLIGLTVLVFLQEIFWCWYENRARSEPSWLRVFEFIRCGRNNRVSPMHDIDMVEDTNILQRNNVSVTEFKDTISDNLGKSSTADLENWDGMDDIRRGNSVSDEEMLTGEMLNDESEHQDSSSPFSLETLGEIQKMDIDNHIAELEFLANSELLKAGDTEEGDNVLKTLKELDRL